MKKENYFYTCPFCSEEYENPIDLAHCILSCEEKKKKEEAAKKAKELALAKEARKREIKEKQQELSELISKYCEDYGSYSSEISWWF